MTNIKVSKIKMSKKGTKVLSISDFKKNDGIQLTPKELNEQARDVSNINAKRSEVYGNKRRFTEEDDQEKVDKIKQVEFDQSVAADFQNKAMIQLAKYRLAKTDFKTYVLLMTSPTATGKTERTLFFTNSTIDQIEQYQELWNNKFVKRLTGFKDLDKEFNKMVVNQPARTWKSYIAKLFISFLLGGHPGEDVLYGSYSVSAANAHIKGPNSINGFFEMEVFKYIFPEFKVEGYGRFGEVITSKEGFKPEQNGKLFPTAPDAGATGFGFNWIFVDDPVKNENKASEDSKAPETLFRWYNSVLMTRFHPSTMGGADQFLILIHTRWNINDLTGQLLKLEQKLIESGQDNQSLLDNGKRVLNNVKFLAYPAIITDSDGNEESNFLIPDEYISQIEEGEVFRDEEGKILAKVQPRDLDFWESEKRTKIGEGLAEQSWQALYQQNPVEGVGGSFDTGLAKHFLFNDLKQIKKDILWCVSVDPGYGTSSSADDTAIGLVGFNVDTNDIYLGAALGGVNQPEINYRNIKKVIGMGEMEDLKISKLLVEKNDRNEDQKQWYRDLQKFLTMENVNSELEPIRPVGSKSMRIESMKGLFDLGKIHFLSGKDDLMKNKDIKDGFGKLKKQLTIWQGQETNNQHDDYPDMLAQAIIWFRDNKEYLLGQSSRKVISKRIQKQSFGQGSFNSVDLQ